MRQIYLFLLLILCIDSSCAKEETPESIEPIAISEEGEKGVAIDETVNDTIIYTFEKYMDLRPVLPYAQGSACYGDYFVQGYNYNGCITIYNLKEKSCLETIDIPAPAPSSKTHSNTLNFGSQRYDSNDYFPLLYVSSGYCTNGVSHIYVYRLLKEEQKGTDIFSISLVQTFSLHFNTWTEGIADIASNNLWIKYEPNDSYGYACYKMPNVFDGDVDIYYEDYIKDFRLDRTPIGSRNQGHLFVDGKIILVTGVPSAGEVIAFISIDTEKEVRDLIIDLVDVGLVNPNNHKDNSFEPEGVIIYNDQLMICYPTALYTLSFKKKDKEPTNIKTTDKDVSLSEKNNRGIYDILGHKRSMAKGIHIMQGDKAYRKIITQ